MINIRDERLLTLAEATHHIPGRVCMHTVHRWSLSGVAGGLKLETVKVGGRRFTSLEAIDRFIAARSQPDYESVAAPTNVAAHDSATRELAEAGI